MTDDCGLLETVVVSLQSTVFSLQSYCEKSTLNASGVMVAVTVN